MVGRFVLRRINPFRVITPNKILKIQFSISTQFRSIWPIDKTLSGATTSGQSRLGSNGNEGVLYIPQSSSITGTSLSNCLVSYLGHSLGESYSSVEKQLMYSTAPVDWEIITMEL